MRTTVPRLLTTLACTLLVLMASGRAEGTTIVDLLNNYVQNFNGWTTFAASSSEACEFVKLISQQTGLAVNAFTADSYMQSAWGALAASSNVSVETVMGGLSYYYGLLFSAESLNCQSYASTGDLDLLALFDTYAQTNGPYWTAIDALKDAATSANIPAPTQAQLENVYCNANLQVIANAVYDANLDFFDYVFTMLFFYVELNTVPVC